MTSKEQARRFVRALRKSTDALYADDDYQAFQSRQRDLWHAIEMASPTVHKLVLEALRRNLPRVTR